MLKAKKLKITNTKKKKKTQKFEEKIRQRCSICIEYRSAKKIAWKKYFGNV